MAASATTISIFTRKTQLSSSRAGSVMVSRMPVPSSTQRAVQTQGVDLAISAASGCAPRVKSDEPETHDVNGSQENRDAMIWTVCTVGTNQLAD